MYEDRKFELYSNFEPRGDQPKAISELIDGFNKGLDKQVLLGVTGSGKTFTISHVINSLNMPTLVLAHNKTLAAQLYNEFKDLFPKNRVEYFVSYYDYYQPESYIPSKDMYVPKDAQVNPKIEQMRVSTTEALATRKDVIVVSSVSCIYSIGDPSMYRKLSLELRRGMRISRKQLIISLLEQQYERNDLEPMPGNFRVRGDLIDVIPSYKDDILRIELYGDDIESMELLDRYNMEVKEDLQVFHLFPAKHFAIDEESRNRAIDSINQELEDVLPTIDDPIIAHRLKTRVKYDVEMIQELGYCKGIENYSIHFDGRSKGDPPFCLLDHFPKDFLIVIDESHQTIPQLHGMYNGDLSRKRSLVDYGFRLPSAYDNRPLRFDEFKRYLNKVVFVSATPSSYEKMISGNIVEQIIRPTGLIDPIILKRPIKGQAEDLIKEINKTVSNNFRVLVTTLTKRMAEELTEYLSERGVKARYLHSEIDTLERSELIRQLRLGTFDVLVGINLLREGIDIPEVALVAILDADKEGFLRNETSIIQIVGRAARNSESRVILYMDNETDSIKNAIYETNRRRLIQVQHNKEHGIVPETIIKPIREQEIILKEIKSIPKAEIPILLEELEQKMRVAADELDFEKAILYRDKMEKLRKKLNVKN